MRAFRLDAMIRGAGEAVERFALLNLASPPALAGPLPTWGNSAALVGQRSSRAGWRRR